MDSLPTVVLGQIVKWLPLREAARFAVTCRALAGGPRDALRRKLEARLTLRGEHGLSMDLPLARAERACRRCGLAASLLGAAGVAATLHLDCVATWAFALYGRAAPAPVYAHGLVRAA